MEERLKTDFDKVIKNLKLSNENIELRKKILTNLLKVDFQIKEKKSGNFLILIK